MVRKQLEREVKTVLLVQLKALLVISVLDLISEQHKDCLAQHKTADLSQFHIWQDKIPPLRRAS